MELPEFNDLQDHHEGHDMLAKRTLSRLNASASSGGMPAVNSVILVSSVISPTRP